MLLACNNNVIDQKTIQKASMTDLGGELPAFEQSFRCTESWCAIHWSVISVLGFKIDKRTSKIGNFDSALTGSQQICRLQITMQSVVEMKVVQALQCTTCRDLRRS